ncbi:osmoprotectant transport system substrate-binding protein [Georgenia satyanarayanai]|uniref:Osmoprotectant transport system substrate-binding protein n=1 Tax=Georgenia satyanarayanai TaxID=860221 RepID=A0A2Y9A410_9MICO|nr:ABC transporter substrate-binding protein [Georgenia satyanarayanai]PYG00931.1 osmoprotectant transport system substrate-binding protein [Georgenia satyanarayanai]SSA39170.1 osmoprotectant transport system substrate-binding protein [Georgenia satyanarayanai]
MKTTRLALLAGVTALTLAACGSEDPLAEPTGEGTTTEAGAVVVGSQAYYSNEIVAEIYAQVLEDAGLDVTRQFQIGQRDVYLQAMEGGEVQVLPEYTGNLLQFYVPDTEARSSEDVATELPDALPEGLAVLEYAEAQDADSYNVTAEFSAENGITSLADLAGYDGEITIGGNAELESRPYGPEGLREFYGVDVEFLAIGDSGGPLTKDAIRDGTITMGDIYTADPDLASGDFVTLEDPESMILAQNVVPLVAADRAEELAPLLDPVSAALTTEALIALNARSVGEQLDSATIATDWLTEQGLLEETS